MASEIEKHRRKFTPDYRREAAHLVIDTGRSIAEVARQINVGEALLGRWVAKERAAMGRPVFRSTSPSGQSWSVCAPRLRSCGWITSFWEKPPPSSHRRPARGRLRVDGCGEGELSDIEDG